MGVRSLIVIVASGALLLVLIIGHHTPAYATTVVDVSWPNCHARHAMVYRHGIVGVTGGLNFRPNKCLAAETGWFASYELYMNTGYPGDSYGRKFRYMPLYCASANNQCLAYNYGYNAALYALNYAAKQDVHTSQWWLDVETENSWTVNPTINRTVLLGAVTAVKRQVFWATVGYYSYPGQWNLLTGSWHNGLPAWSATGQVTRVAAALACQMHSFTGGVVLYGQYTVLLDQNLPCR
jgi:hypothetical protein